MKNFNYTARDNAGALKKGSLQAADRNAALVALREKGFIPVSIIEGGKASLPPSVSRGFNIPLLAAGLVLIIVAAVALKMWPKAADGKQPKKAKAEQTVKKAVAVAPKVENVAAPKAPSAQTQARVESETLVPKPSVSHEASSVVTAAITNKLAGENSATNRPVRVFKTATEQIIGWIANSKLGDPPPPLPRLPPGDDIAAILNSDIILNDDDSKAIEEAKYNVAAAKQLLKEYIAKGGKPDDFLAYYHTELRNAHTEWRESQLQLMELYKAGDTAGALKYAEEQNKVLQNKGIKSLVIPLQR